MSGAVLNGLRTTMRDWGSGRPLLCLHPLGQEAAFFAGLAEALDGGWRVVSYDQRGHGDAVGQPAEGWEQLVEDARAALAEVGARHVAGFSLGGAVAADLAGRAALDALALVATPGRGLPLFADRARAVAGGGLHAVADETVSRWFGAAAEGPEAARARASLMRMRPEGFDAAWRAFAAFGGYEGRALPPTLALAYGDDLSTPPAVLDGIAAAIRAAGGAARRETIPGAGHMGLLQAPRETGAAIASFLEARR